MAGKGRKPGNPKKGGRKKGGPHKRTYDFESALEARGVNLVDALVNTLPELDAFGRANTLLKLMEFVYPKRKAIEHFVENKVATDETRLQKLEELAKLAILGHAE